MTDMQLKENNVIDQRMEELSDLVRKGIPIDFKDALAVIKYQEDLRKNITKHSTFIEKIGIFFNKLRSWC